MWISIDLDIRKNGDRHVTMDTLDGDRSDADDWPWKREPPVIPVIFVPLNSDFQKKKQG